jgi:hypothetical protein
MIFIYQLNEFVFFIHDLTLVLVLVIWIYGMFDAWRTAQKINRGELEFTRKSRLFWFPATALILSVFFTVIIVIIVIFSVILSATGIGVHGNGPAADDPLNKNITETLVKPDTGHIVVTIQQGRDMDKIRELWVSVTDDTGKVQTKTLGWHYDEVTPGEKVTFTGPYAGRNYVYSKVIYNDFNETEILNTYI